MRRFLRSHAFADRDGAGGIGAIVRGAVLTALAAAGLSAQTLYWDTNGNTEGAATKGDASNTWSTSTKQQSKLWTTDSFGKSNTIAWTDGSSAVFSAGNDTATATVTVATVTAAAITFEEGIVTLTGGNLTLSAGATITANVDATISSTIGGTNFSKAGTGVLTLSGANIFTGALTISSGTVKLGTAGSGANSPLGTTAGGTIVNAGGVLDLNGFTLATAETLSLNGSGIGSTGALTNSAGAATFSGAITLASTSTIGGSGNVELSGVVSGSGGLVKTGTNTLTLSGANTFTGQTRIEAGTLSVSSLNNVGSASSSLGAPSTVAAGTIDLGSGTTTGTLAFTGATYQSTNRVVNLAGTTGGGVIDGSGAGGVAFTSNLTVTGAGAKSLTLTGSNSANAFSGAIVNGTDATSLVKDGTGTWTLNGSGANTFTGTTTVNAGTLALAKTGGVTAIGGNLVIGDGSGTDTVRLDAANQIAATAAVTFNAAGTPTLNLNGFSQTLGSIASTNTGAQLQLGSPGSATTFTVGNATNTTFAGAISGGSNASFNKQGAGTLTLSGSSTYTGLTTVSAGTLNAQSDNALGTGNVTVANGATLQLQGSGLSLGSGSATVTITGNGTGTGGNDGALLNVGGGSTRLKNNVALGGAATFSSGSTSGATLIVGGAPPSYTIGVSAPDTNTVALGSNTLTFVGGAGTTTRIDSNITGTGGVDVNTSGTVHYNANKNTYTGTTTVKNGTLIVDTADNNFAPHSGSFTSFWGVNGPLVIGDNTGAANSAVVQLGSASSSTNDAINSTAAVTLYRDGYLNLNGNFQNVGKLSMTGGTIAGGTLYLDYANTSVDIVPSSTSGTSFINGSLSLTFLKDAATEGALPNQVRTFNVGHDSNNASDLTINAVVGNGSLVKTGAGTMTLATSNNTYAGSTTVNNGILNVRVGTENLSGANRSSLGSGDGDGSTGAGTTVASGGTLQLQGGITFTHEQLTLSGDGYNPGTGLLGALNNLSGNNTWGGSSSLGTISLGANARITSSADLLTIATTISSTSGNNFQLTFDGSGNTTVSGSINTGGAASTVTKTGTGTLTLTGANGYQGATNIQQGIVSAQNDNALGATSTGTNGTFVTSGAELQLSNAAHGNLSIGAESLSLNGTGTTGAGALRNISGNNSFGGLVTIASTSLITSNSGQTLTLTGGTTSASQSLTIGSSAQNGDVNIWGMSNGNGALTKAGSGTLTVSGSSATVGTVALTAGTLNFNSTTTSTGVINVNAGTLNFNGANASTGLVHLNSGAINVSGASLVNTGAIDSAVGTTLTIASGGSLVANYASGSTTFSGALAGGGEFQKDGSGTLVFNHTFAATNLTLTLNGGTLSLLGGQFTFGTIHITGNTILDFNNSAGTFLSSANVIIDAGVTVTVNNWISVANNTAASTIWYATNATSGVQGSSGNLTLAGGTISGTSPLNQVSFTNYGGMTTTWVSGTTNGWFDREIRPTPEPATYGAVFLGGCVGLLGWRRYRRRKA